MYHKNTLHTFLFKTITTIAFSILCITLNAQPACNVTSYYETATNESIHHIKSILQDKNGMIWITTWGGLFSFDGKKFNIHQEHTTKSLGHPTQQMRGVQPCPTGDKWQPNRKEVYMTDKYGTQWHITPDAKVMYTGSDGREHVYAGLPEFKDYRGSFVDNQKNIWIVCYYSLHKLSFSYHNTENISECTGERPRCMHRFANGDYWICLRSNNSILIYGSDDLLKGYLTSDGKISKTPAQFGAAVFCIYETGDGRIWMGTRLGGLFCLKKQSDTSYAVEQIISKESTTPDTYDIERDRHGRLWLAMFDGGLRCISENIMPQQISVPKLKHYDYKNFSRVHDICIYNDTILVATSEGLVIADISNPNTQNITFKYNKYDKNHPQGISSNLIDYIYISNDKHIYVCTENAGVNVCTSASLLSDKLTFKQIDRRHGLPDISFSMTENNGLMCMTSLYSISIMKNPMTDCQISSFGTDFFGKRHRFVEIPPMLTASGKWIIAIEEGALMVSPDDLTINDYQPNIVVTGIDIAGHESLHYTEIPEEITLQPDQRSFKIEFAALDYTNPNVVSYAYRLKNQHQSWIPLQNDRSISFSNISPGKYTLEIRATNSSGVWSKKTACIKLNVPPRFIETQWAMPLFIIIALTIIGTITYTVLYMRRMKRRYNEVMMVYLSLIGNKIDDNNPSETIMPSANATAQTLPAKPILMNEHDEAFVRKMTEYIDQNLSNPDLKIEMIADHMSVSISTLTRMTKSLMGITPGGFLAKARIRKAIMIVDKNSGMTISEIAYECGFADPKYFSRRFKSETKMTPTEYLKNKHE